MTPCQAPTETVRLKLPFSVTHQCFSAGLAPVRSSGGPDLIRNGSSQHALRGNMFFSRMSLKVRTCCLMARGCDVSTSVLDRHLPTLNYPFNCFDLLLKRCLMGQKSELSDCAVGVHTVLVLRDCYCSNISVSPLHKRQLVFLDFFVATLLN